MFFFFKQKTAYEMRISDWSSDVCSSDLNIAYGAAQTRGFSDSGTQTTSFPDGEFAAVPNSSYPFTPTLGQDFTGRLGTMASQSRTQSETYANLAQQSTSSALTRFSEIRNAYSQGQSSETVSGGGTNERIGTTFSEVDHAPNKNGKAT